MPSNTAQRSSTATRVLRWSAFIATVFSAGACGDDTKKCDCETAGANSSCNGGSAGTSDEESTGGTRRSLQGTGGARRDAAGAGGAGEPVSGAAGSDASGSSGMDDATGGTQQNSSGGSQNATGGRQNATGGTQSSTGGTQSSSGGRQDSTGGVQNATGGTQNPTGGHENGTGGSQDGVGGSLGGTGGTSDGSGGSLGGTGGGTSDGSGGTPNVGAECTRFYDDSTALEDIQDAINSAAGGDVICLARGASWGGRLQLTNTAPTGESRVVLCASAGGENCTSGGAANPRISGPSGGVAFSEDADGFIIRNIDFACESGCRATGAVGVDFGGTSHVRIEGGLISGWEQGLICNSWTTSAPCDDIEIGVPDNITELANNDNGFYGWLSNSYVRIDAHDNGATALEHHFYLSSGSHEIPSTNVVFEYGTYTRASVNSEGLSLGTFLNISGQNRNLVIRNNVFREPACLTFLIDIATAGEDPEEFCDGIEIYGNYFESNCPRNLSLLATQHARVYNNVFVVGGTIMTAEDEEWPAGDNWFFNNTVYWPGSTETGFSFHGDDNRFFNNVIHYAQAQASLFAGGSAACDRFGGASAPGYHNNFFYTTNSNPGFPSCGVDNSTDYDTLPGFVDAEGRDFHISASSAVAGFGDSADAPAVDFDGNPRANPPSAGAYDVE